MERSADGDRFETVESVVEAHHGDDIGALIELLTRREVAIVTLTITEAGYLTGADGNLRTDDPTIIADVAAVRAGRDSGEAPSVRSAVARLVIALRERLDSAAPPVAVISCDNLPDNGRILGRACHAFADQLDFGAFGWLDEIATFVCTSVDRITPRITPADETAVRDETGHIDHAPVVTEPFSDWVLEGEFPSGRPAWESAGARFVTDIVPWELRKLRLLNGAHTLLAALGVLYGHETVDAAIRDPRCRNVVTAWWDEVSRHLPDGLDLPDYRSALLARFENPRIAHQLAQIGQDARAKVRIRIVPTVVRELDESRRPQAGLTAIAALLTLEGIPSDEACITAALADISPILAERPDVVSTITRIATRLPAPPTIGAS